MYLSRAFLLEVHSARSTRESQGTAQSVCSGTSPHRVQRAAGAGATGVRACAVRVRGGVWCSNSSCTTSTSDAFKQQHPLCTCDVLMVGSLSLAELAGGARRRRGGAVVAAPCCRLGAVAPPAAAASDGGTTPLLLCGCGALPLARPIEGWWPRQRGAAGLSADGSEGCRGALDGQKAAGQPWQRRSSRECSERVRRIVRAAPPVGTPPVAVATAGCCPHPPCILNG